jgi:hypothetical protein
MPQYGQQYVLALSSEGRDSHIELGFSTNMIPFLKQIRDCLGADSQEPIAKVIEQTSRWQR